MNWLYFRYLIGLLVLLGCTGTEVGNPEMMEVLAKFGTTRQDTCGVDRFHLRVQGVHFFRNGESLKLWESEEGHLIDFAANDEKAFLPKKTMPENGWDSVSIDVKPDSNNGQNIQSTEWENFRNGNFIKGWAMYQGEKIRFLFEIPEMRMDFICRSGLLSSWHKEDRLEMNIIFDSNHWIRNFSLSKAEKTFDANGDPVVLLSYESNETVFKSMLERFQNSFNADSVMMRQM